MKTLHFTLPSKIAATSTHDKNEAEGSTTTASSVGIVKRVPLRELRHHAHRERTGFLPSSALEGRGGRVDIVISDVAVGHTLVDIVVADPTRRDLVERAVVLKTIGCLYNDI